MNGFVKPRLSKTERVEFLDKLSRWERFKYKYLNTTFLQSVLLKIFRFVLLVGVAYVIIFPFISKISTSLMSESDFADTSVYYIPKNPTLDTYKAIIQENDYWEALRNTALLSVGCGVIQMFFCALVGYGFAKFNFRGKKLLFIAVILTMIVPHETIQLSLFTQFRYFDVWGIAGSIKSLILSMQGQAVAAKQETVNLLDSYWPLAILSMTCLAFKNGLFIFVYRQFYRGVPDELEEAAYVDGASVMKTYMKIIVPMSIPIFVTIFMFAFSWQWTDMFYTELFFPSTTGMKLLPDIVSIPSSLGTDGSQVREAWEAAVRNTCGILILLPLLVVYLFAQKTLIQGIERSGITG